MSSPTLRGRLLDHYRRHADRLYVRVVFPDGREARLTYGGLVERGSQIARLLRAWGLPPGAVCLVIVPHSPDLYCAFFGAILGGLVPTILALPSFKLNAEHYQQELAALLDRIDGRAVLADAETAERLSLRERGLGKARLLIVDEVAPEAGAIPDCEPQPDDIVLLQHSSGSTGLKKGVALSNRAVLAQADAYADVLAFREDDRIASWLPLYHDMGLIACAVVPMVAGVPVSALSPFHWVTHPTSLLRIIDDDRCTLAWMPNFAYDFLASRARNSQLGAVRLDSMRGWINCSEPTIAESHRRFLERFRSIGVRPETLWTCYAAAETTFAVTQSTDREPPRVDRVERSAFLERAEAVPVSDPDVPTLEMLSGGPLIAGCDVRVVDDKGAVLVDRRVGEIAIEGKFLFSGYFKDPEGTAAALRGGWYYSGDLGYRAEGHLYITGRKKDLIIIGGRNFYPQDIERLVSEVPGVYPGRVVALGLEDATIGTQRLIVLAEVDDPARVNDADIGANVRTRVSEHLDCVIDDLRLLPHMWLLKTSSGKIARAPNLKRYLTEPPAS